MHTCGAKEGMLVRGEWYSIAVLFRLVGGGGGLRLLDYWLTKKHHTGVTMMRRRERRVWRDG